MRFKAGAEGLALDRKRESFSMKHDGRREGSMTEAGQLFPKPFSSLPHMHLESLTLLYQEVQAYDGVPAIEL